MTTGSCKALSNFWREAHGRPGVVVADRKVARTATTVSFDLYHLPYLLTWPSLYITHMSHKVTIISAQILNMQTIMVKFIRIYLNICLVFTL